MKKKIILVAMAALVMQTSVLHAVDNSQTGKQGQDKSMQMDSQQGMANMGMMMKKMDKMMQQMKEIQATDDPKKRQKLMHEHMQDMRENMQMMRSMGGGSMMKMMAKADGGAMASKGMTTNKAMKMDGVKGMDKNMATSGMSKDDMNQRHQMMEQRMDMMQMMMEQMMEHDGMMSKMKK